jgi:hypothetical protein
MTILNNFIKRRILQLLKEYGSPELVIEQLRDVLPVESYDDNDEILILEEYIRQIWNGEAIVPENARFLPDFTSGDLAEWMYSSNGYMQNCAAGIPEPSREEITEDMIVTLKSLEEGFCEVLLEEEIATQRNLAEVQFDFSEYADKLQRLPILGDVIILVRYFQSESAPVIPRKKDGDIKRNFIKKLGRLLNGNKTSFRSEEDFYRYTEFLCDLVTESEILYETDEGEVITTQISSEIAKGEVNYSEIYNLLFKTWWMDFRDFFVDDTTKPLLIDPGEVEFKATSLLQAVASKPALAQDIYVPTIVNNWLEFQSYRPINQNEGRISLLQGIKDVHFHYFKPYILMGVLEIVPDKAGQTKLQLSDFAVEALKTIMETYSPLLKADVQLTAAYDIIKSFLIISSLFFHRGENDTEDAGSYELQKMAAEIELAINSFFFYVADPMNNRENIEQIRKTSDYILEEVTSAIETHKKNIKYNDLMEHLFKPLNC